MRKYKFSIGFIFLCLFCISSGCTKDDHKTLVSAHTTVGELLITTKDQAVFLHVQKIISDGTYESIRINWVRAQKTYVDASDMLDKIITSEDGDISTYLQLLTQTSNILLDITKWMQEDTGGTK